MTRLPARGVVTPDGVVGPAVVVVDDGLIVGVEPARGAVPDWVLAPGFVDLQVNGIGAIDVAHARDGDWARLDGALLAQGVTTWCPTIVTAPLDRYDEPLAAAAEAAARPSDGRPTIAGAHLEGPFLGGAPGAHPAELLRPLDPAWLASLRPIVRVVTLAPELAGATEAIRALRARGILVALGHTAATVDEMGAAAAAGAQLVTHLFNGMPPLHHRTPGPVGAALTDDRLTVSLIADLVHVHSTTLTLAFRVKGAGRVALVTDAVAWEAERVGGIGIGFVDGAPRLPDGTLAGSALTMDKAVANVVHECGVDLADAVAAASTTPARLLGLADRGALEPGRRADLVALSPGLGVLATWVGGVEAYSLGQ